MNRFAGFIRKFNIDKIKSFFVKNWRYFGAVAVVVAMMLILARCTNGTAADENPMAGAYQEYTENEDEKIDELIEAYFSYYAAGDVDGLQTVAMPISDAESSYIRFYSQYVEQYQNIKVYTKRGIDADSYLCSVYLEIKFTDIDTPVAGLDFFYVETGEDGQLYINNVYGSFNQTNGEYDMDSDVASLIATFEQQADVLALQAEVQEKCNEAMLSDDKLSTFVNVTLQQSIAQWATDYQAELAKAAEEAAAAEAAAAEAQAKAEEEAAAQAAAEAEAAAAAEAASAEEANAVTRVTTDTVNVRDSASGDGNLLGQLSSGSEVTVYAEENGWSKIDYNGTRAYVKSEYLGEPGTETAGEETTAESRTVLLSSTINVRESMSESAAKVAVAYAGNTITVYQDYAEGWSRVNYQGKDGYCKTELLQ
jgi:SH3-like domain-containing protein